MTPAPHSGPLRRHGRDILLPYEWLTHAAGFTLTDQHLDRLIARINVAGPTTIGETLGDHADSMLTDTERGLLLADVDPFDGHAPAAGPAPCVPHITALLDRLRDILTAYDAHSGAADSDEATRRDLDCFDDLMQALGALNAPDSAPPSTPASFVAERELYFTLAQLCRTHGRPTTATYPLLYSAASTVIPAARHDSDPT